MERKIGSFNSLVFFSLLFIGCRRVRAQKWIFRCNGLCVSIFFQPKTSAKSGRRLVGERWDNCCLCPTYNRNHQLLFVQKALTLLQQEQFSIRQHFHCFKKFTYTYTEFNSKWMMIQESKIDHISLFCKRNALSVEIVYVMYIRCSGDTKFLSPVAMHGHMC